MGALPTRKYAKSRQRKRRTHLRLTAKGTVLCPRCRAPKLPHRVCLECGSYHGRDAITIKTKRRTEQ